jgi:uncharacterized protein involved in type VI secretion and phage assembly
MAQINGVVVGIVKGLEDRQNLGRIELHFPWMSDSNKSHWARVATLMSGPGRGSWFMPEIDDEVLVAFEHGDPQHPYIVGYLWNGKDKPPNGDIDRSVRRIKTVSGHTVDLDDRSGKEKIRLRTKDGQEVCMEDNGARITVKTKSATGAEMVLEDSGKITMKVAAGATTLVMSRSGFEFTTVGSLSIKAAQGMSVQSAGGMTVQASSSVSITCPQVSMNTPFASFSGLVTAQVVQSTVGQITLLQSNAIVSTAYTPGVGNFYGL